jgi:formate dehydrogenase gamma subunit
MVQSVKLEGRALENCRKFLQLLMFSALLLAPVQSANSQASNACMICHGNSSLTMKKGGKILSLFVDESSMKTSVHGAFQCVSCHVGLNPGAMPHAKVIKPVDCKACHPIKGFEISIHGTRASCKACHGTHDILLRKNPKSMVSRLNISNTCAHCHEAKASEYRTSAHGLALQAGSNVSPTCVNCHGAHDILLTSNRQSPVFKGNEADLCLKCHLENPQIRKQIGVSAWFIEGYKTSIHGAALAAGNLKSATCSDCHGAHDVKNSTDPSARTNKRETPHTCSRCHDAIAKIYGESIHGTAVRNGNMDAPSCTDCHGEHQIFSPTDARARVAPMNVSEQVCGRCHNSVQLSRRYGMPSNQFKTFSDSYHGLAARAGSIEVANCASCHGIHNIKPSSDPASSINAKNLAATCGRCHPGANRNFAQGAVHVIAGTPSGEGILNWIRGIYLVLIAVTIGAMFFHNFLDFIRRGRQRLAIRRGEAVHSRAGSDQYVRMTLNERIQHAAMFCSFTVLAVTGFMLRFPDAWWVSPLREISGTFYRSRGAVHRMAGAVMILISLYHLGYLFVVKRGRQFGRDMLPKWKDVRDVWSNLGYIAGLSKNKPRFDRFSYIEKAEYWALIWGVMVMAGTGIIMWFDNYFINHLTKLGWDISRTIHFYEACLATLAILVWHFYFVIFNPDIYPMKTAWLTGKISEEEMEEEHPLELERLRKSGKREA